MNEDEVYGLIDLTRIVKELRQEVKLIRYNLERFNERLDRLERSDV